MQVLVCGGGTGGHVYPALAVVAKLREDGLAKSQFLWVGTRGQMEEELVPREGLALETIRGGPIVGVAPHRMMMNAGKLMLSVGTSLRIFREFRPDVIFLTGGYVNVPVALAAQMRRVPAAIYLPDVEPGSAIRTLSRVAAKVACTTDVSTTYFAPGKSVVTGYPVRPSLREAAGKDRTEAAALFDLGTERRTLLVFGGSRGARSINRALQAILPQLLDEMQIIHISGTLDWQEVEAAGASLPAAQQQYYRPYPYLHRRMGAAFRAADLVVARAGASMLGELPAFGLPAILVPYPHAWRYQKVNADYLASRGVAVRLDDDVLGDQLLPTVQMLIQDDKRLAAMGKAARALDRPEAAAAIARLLTELAEGTH